MKGTVQPQTRLLTAKRSLLHINWIMGQGYGRRYGTLHPPADTKCPFGADMAKKHALLSDPRGPKM